MVILVYPLLACDPGRSWRGYVQSVSCPLSAQWRHVASAPFALRPGLSHEVVTRTTEIRTTKERDKRKCGLPPLTLSCSRPEAGHGPWKKTTAWADIRSSLLTGSTSTAGLYPGQCGRVARPEDLLGEDRVQSHWSVH